MRIYAASFIYKRPVLLRYNLRSIFANTVQPDRHDLIDDASGPETEAVYRAEMHGKPQTVLFRKADNMGACDSFALALGTARKLNPEYFFPIEADYIFKPWAFETVLDIFEHTEEGRNALGIVGYDHPLFYSRARDELFPAAMRAQVGEDNVNRAALWRPRYSRRCVLELVSNTCPTCYLHWRKIREVAAEFPELDELIEQVGHPRDNPNYPDSGKYRRTRQTDDGMLSHAISLVWNRWAIKHGINRDRFGAWLNIKPSIAQNVTGGGVNSTVKDELATDGGSPTWVD